MRRLIFFEQHFLFEILEGLFNYYYSFTLISSSSETFGFSFLETVIRTIILSRQARFLKHAH